MFRTVTGLMIVGKDGKFFYTTSETRSAKKTHGFSLQTTLIPNAFCAAMRGAFRAVARRFKWILTTSGA